MIKQSLHTVNCHLKPFQNMSFVTVYDVFQARIYAWKVWVFVGVNEWQKLDTENVSKLRGDYQFIG